MLLSGIHVILISQILLYLQELYLQIKLDLYLSLYVPTREINRDLWLSFHVSTHEIKKNKSPFSHLKNYFRDTTVPTLISFYSFKNCV